MPASFNFVVSVFYSRLAWLIGSARKAMLFLPDIFIRLDAPSTRLLVNYFIEQSSLSEDERSSLREKLKSVPVAVLQESITKLLAEKISYQGVLAFLMNML